MAVPLPDPESQVREDYSQAKVGDDEWEWEGGADGATSAEGGVGLGDATDANNDWSRDADEGLTAEEAAEGIASWFLYNISSPSHTPLCDTPSSRRRK